MLKDTWKEIGRLENIFLEIIDDPLKKEVLLYPICYCQIVRRENTFEVELPKLISCANKTFQTYKNRWQDILLELDLFMFIAPNGEVLYGKDLLSVSSPEGFTVSFLPEYREIFFDVYSKLLKYWAILSRISSYTKRNTPAEIVYLTSVIFNEELFKECSLYASHQAQRFHKEKNFFEAVKDMSDFYVKFFSNEKDIKLLISAYEKIEKLKKNYYGINTDKLRKDLYNLIESIEEGNKVYIIKIGFWSSNSDSGFSLRRLWKKIVNKLKSIGGRRWTLTSSEIAYSYFIETCLKRQKEQVIPS